MQIGTEASPIRWSGRLPRKQGVRADVGGLAKLTEEPLQPREFVTRRVLVGVPHHDSKMVPPQGIADRFAGRIDVDGLLSCDDLADAKGTDAVLVLQPAFSFVLVDGDHLLRDPVDVLEQRPADRLQHVEARRWRHIGRAHFTHNELVHPPLTQPVGADKRVDRNTVLRQPPRILDCRHRRLDSLHRDVVSQRVQKGLDVRLDARVEQLDEPGIRHAARECSPRENFE